MEKLKKLFEKYREVIMYVFFGALTTLVSLVSFKLSNVILGEELYLVSNIISWVLAVTFAFITNKKWVFRSEIRDSRGVLREALSFFAARLTSFFIEEGGLFLFMDILGMKGISYSILGFKLSGSMTSKLLMQVIVLVLNYVFSKFIVFVKKK